MQKRARDTHDDGDDQRESITVGRPLIIQRFGANAVNRWSRSKLIVFLTALPDIFPINWRNDPTYVQPLLSAFANAIEGPEAVLNLADLSGDQAYERVLGNREAGNLMATIQAHYRNLLRQPNAESQRTIDQLRSQLPLNSAAGMPIARALSRLAPDADADTSWIFDLLREATMAFLDVRMRQLRMFSRFGADGRQQFVTPIPATAGMRMELVNGLIHASNLRLDALLSQYGGSPTMGVDWPKYIDGIDSYVYARGNINEGRGYNLARNSMQTIHNNYFLPYANSVKLLVVFARTHQGAVPDPNLIATADQCLAALKAECETCQLGNRIRCSRLRNPRDHQIRAQDLKGNNLGAPGQGRKQLSIIHLGANHSGQDLKGNRLNGKGLQDNRPSGKGLRNIPLSGKDLKDHRLNGKDLRDHRLSGKLLRDKHLSFKDLRDHRLSGKDFNQLGDEEVRGQDLRCIDFFGLPLDQLLYFGLVFSRLYEIFLTM
ncbi:hypothetical protein J7T55_007346 [Diaporthe amygdali]|uniref:uncharacterized protein n=1 Tax=Phomopsis amygdali TaxID=1214568 RepID=UPI0022FE4A14|nr:uncharacterized protein J7T55_007346 [Diaporthe amygdali]KAJ0116366.1 hypothetical protein J7T55_007346 [Diaporthe amygdali]